MFIYQRVIYATMGSVCIVMELSMIMFWIGGGMKPNIGTYTNNKRDVRGI